jgi:hypothetical protein
MDRTEFDNAIANDNDKICQSNDGSFEFYKTFYEEHHVSILQYKSLRRCFNRMSNIILGTNYYNMSMDVYGGDADTCEDIITKCRRWWQKKRN